MSRNTTPRTSPPRVLGLIALGLAVVTATMLGIAVGQSAISSAQSFNGLPGDGGAPSEADGTVDAADGVFPDGTSVFDDGYPGIARLDPALLQALRAAAADGPDELSFTLTSGWRSPEYQEQLLREAVADYGSEAEAARWVATPETSAHVSGHAVDVYAFDTYTWLAEHGAAYGLCPVYDNEPWHIELDPDAIAQGCPPTYADPTEDPRMRR